MSLYNMLFGICPGAGIFLKMLGLDVKEVPRLRDCYLNEDGSEIIIYTRTGGGNREAFKEENEALTKVPGYKLDYNDSFDSTFAYFVYRVPEQFREPCKRLLKEHPEAHRDPSKFWEEMQTNPSDRVKAVAGKLGDEIAKAFKDEEPK